MPKNIDRDSFNESVDKFAKSSEESPVSDGGKNIAKRTNEQHVPELKSLSDAEIEELTSFEGDLEYFAELLKDKKEDYRLSPAEEAKMWFLRKRKLDVNQTRKEARETLSSTEDSDDEVS